MISIVSRLDNHPVSSAILLILFSFWAFWGTLFLEEASAFDGARTKMHGKAGQEYQLSSHLGATGTVKVKPFDAGKSVHLEAYNFWLAPYPHKSNKLLGSKTIKGTTCFDFKGLKILESTDNDFEFVEVKASGGGCGGGALHMDK